MMKATAKDLRFHSRELLDAVLRGEEVIITYRGRPCARLVPYEKAKKGKKKERNELFGIWKDYKEVQNVDRYIRKLRRGRFEDAD